MLRRIRLVWLVVLLCCWVSLKAENVSMKKLKGIYVGTNPSKAIQKAISNFNSGMGTVYGRKYRLPVLKEIPAKGEQAVVLGSAAVELGLISKDEIAKVAPGGFVIKCIDGKIAIAAENPWSVRYGVGRFFESKQGLRFLKTNIWVCQKNPPEVLQPFTIVDKPAFFYRNGRDIILGGMWDEIADPRKGADSEIFKKTDLWTDHSAGYLVPKDLYYDKHPEYYAMLKNGKRIAKNSFTYHRTPLCLSNPEVLKISVERAVKWVEKEIEKKFFFITYGDTSLWCQCPECLKLDDKPGEHASRLLYWVNNIAKSVSAKYPGRMFFTFAYYGSDNASVKVKPADNVGVVVATSCGNIPFWEHAKNTNNKLYLNAWGKINTWRDIGTKNIFVCEYIANSYQPAFIDQTAGRYKTYAKEGIKGIVFSYGKPKNFSFLWLYLHGKLTWNPNADALGLAKDFSEIYYGNAAEAISRYFDLMHAQYLKTLKENISLVANYPKNFYTEDFIRQAVQCFDDARKALNKPSTVKDKFLKWGKPFDNSESLKKEVNLEKKLFLQNALKHLSDYSLSVSNKKLIGFILDDLVISAKESNSFTAFVKAIDITARSFKTRYPKVTAFIRGKVHQTPDLKPEKIKNGLKFTPIMFIGVDIGPVIWDAKKSHPNFPCPPKLASGVMAKARSSRGVWTNTVMSIKFNALDDFLDNTVKLSLNGQDGISKWAGKRQFNIKSEMLVTLNGKKIYKGECGFVRGNWSGRNFNIPVGMFKKGENVVSIKNVTPQTYGSFAACFVLISDLKLESEAKPETRAQE